MSVPASNILSISQNQADVPGSIGKAMALKEMTDRNQLNALQLGAAKEEAADAAKVKAILKDSDYSTPEGLAATAARVNKVSPRASMDLLKQGQQYQSGQIAQQLQMYTLAEKRQDMIVSTLDGVIAEARQLKNNGGSDLDVNALITQRMPAAIQSLRAERLPDGKPALPDDQLKMVSSQPFTLATLESWEAKSKQGQAQIKQRLEQFKADTQAKGEATKERSEDERERHDLAMETATKAKAQGFTDTESNLLASLADKNVSLPAGLRSQAQIRSTLDGLLRKHPDLSPDEIAEGIKSGKLKLTAETKAAATAGGQIGKVSLAANELDTFGDQVLEASKDLPRGVSLTLNQIRQASEKQLSDPKLLRLKAKLNALNNAYDQLAARGGTDTEKRAHIHELFDQRLSDQAIHTLVQSVKEEAAGAREAADRSIAETSGSSIPGTGGGGGPPPAQVTGAQLKPGAKYQHPSGATVEIIG